MKLCLFLRNFITLVLFFGKRTFSPLSLSYIPNMEDNTITNLHTKLLTTENLTPINNLAPSINPNDTQSETIWRAISHRSKPPKGKLRLWPTSSKTPHHRRQPNPIHSFDLISLSLHGWHELLLNSTSDNEFEYEIWWLKVRRCAESLVYYAFLYILIHKTFFFFLLMKRKYILISKSDESHHHIFT